MSKRSRTSKAEGPNGGQDITQMWAKAKQKKESAEATEEVVKAVREIERDNSHVIKQFHENTFTAFTEAQKGGDVEDIQEDQHKLVDAISSLAQQEGGGLPSKKLFTSILLSITENRSAKLSVRAYELLKKLQQKFPATMVLPGDKLGQKLPYLQVDKEVWTPLDALPGSTPLRGTAAAASALPPPRAGARPRLNADGTVGRPGDLFEVLDHIVEDLKGDSEALAFDAAPSQRSRKTKKQTDGAELDEAGKHQARLEATEALAVQKLGSCLMFKYLVALLYDDLSCRLAVYRAHDCGTDLAILVNSMLYRLLIERRTKPQRDQVWSCIFAIIKAGALERAEEVPAPSTAPTKSEGTDDMEIDAKTEEASGTPTAKKGKTKKGKGRRSSTATVSQRGEEATSSKASQVEVEVETPFDAALQKRRDDTAAEHGLSCSRQDLCTTAQTLLASMLELTATMENHVNLWKANDTRKDLLERMITEFNPNRCWDPRWDTQRHFLETMLSPEQKLRFIIEYFLAICPKGSEAVKVLQQKGRKATACDLLTAVRENVKKMLSSRHSTPDELSLLVAHAAQADLLLGTVNGDRLKQLKQELDETSETVGAPDKRGLPLSASSHAALVAASITIRLNQYK